MLNSNTIDVEVQNMTSKHFSTLRSILKQDDIDLMNVLIHLPKSDSANGLIWALCFKKKKGWCINGFAYIDIQPNACILRLKEYLPIKWTEQMEYDLLKGVEKKVRSKGVELPVWLLLGTLTVHAIA